MRYQTVFRAIVANARPFERFRIPTGTRILHFAEFDMACVRVVIAEIARDKLTPLPFTP
jgi:hypothetical protein